MGLRAGWLNGQLVTINRLLTEAEVLQHQEAARLVDLPYTERWLRLQPGDAASCWRNPTREMAGGPLIINISELENVQEL